MTRDLPKHGFTINMTEGDLRVPPQDSSRHTKPTLNLRVSSIHQKEIIIPIKEAKEFVQTAIDHGADPFQDYAPQVGEAAHSWADRGEYQKG